jgi:hypothetical protein
MYQGVRPPASASIATVCGVFAHPTSVRPGRSGRRPDMAGGSSQTNAPRPGSRGAARHAIESPRRRCDWRRDRQMTRELRAETERYGVSTRIIHAWRKPRLYRLPRRTARPRDLPLESKRGAPSCGRSAGPPSFQR